MSLVNAIRKYFARAGQEVEEAHSPAAGRESDAGHPWIGVDLDGTLAFYDDGSSITEIGPPVAAMMARVQKLIEDGWCVKIVTARACIPDQLPLIQQWLRENGLPPLEITNCKDFNMVVFYDDRCIQVEANTGKVVRVERIEEEDAVQPRDTSITSSACSSWQRPWPG